MPQKTAQLRLDFPLTANQFAILQRGEAPEDDFERWHLECDGMHLRYYRNATGYCFFDATVEPAGDAYVVGDWVNGQFVPCQKTKMLHYGKSAYAGQSFNHAPNGRIVRMAWGRWYLSTPRFDGQMTIPTEMGLVKKDGEYYLTAKIVEELSVLYKETKKEENFLCKKGEIVKIPLTDDATLIRFKGNLPTSGSVRVEVFGRPFRLNFAENAVTMTGNRLPMGTHGEEFEVTLLVDRCSFEFFADEGRGYISDSTAHTIMDRNLCYMTFEAVEDYTFTSVEATALKSIWEETV
jgi:sucrose-6-phosphate hydrolase SacC (GH32 family)